MKSNDFFAAATLGLFIGFILGLSMGEVTGIILSSLIPTITLYIGLKEGKGDSGPKKLFIGIFSLFCSLSLAGGLWTRTHNLLSPSIEQQYRTYKSILNDSVAKILIIAKESGITPEKSNFHKDAKSNAQLSALFMSEIEYADFCQATYGINDLEGLKQLYKDSGKEFQDMEEKICKVIKDSSEQYNVLLLLKEQICKSQNR